MVLINIGITVLHYEKERDSKEVVFILPEFEISNVFSETG